MYVAAIVFLPMYENNPFPLALLKKRIKTRDTIMIHAGLRLTHGTSIEQEKQHATTIAGPEKKT
jgi:hypothetical protein